MTKIFIFTHNISFGSVWAAVKEVEWALCKRQFLVLLTRRNFFSKVKMLPERSDNFMRFAS